MMLNYEERLNQLELQIDFLHEKMEKVVAPFVYRGTLPWIEFEMASAIDQMLTIFDVMIKSGETEWHSHPAVRMARDLFRWFHTRALAHGFDNDSFSRALSEAMKSYNIPPAEMPKPETVKIIVRGGVAELAADSSKRVDVIITDYDVDGSDGNLHQDEEGSYA